MKTGNACLVCTPGGRIGDVGTLIELPSLGSPSLRSRPQSKTVAVIATQTSQRDLRVSSTSVSHPVFPVTSANS